MQSSTTYFVLALVGGPAIALLILATGCALPWQLLGVMCGHNGYMSLTLFTFGAWALFVVAAVAINIRKKLK